MRAKGSKGVRRMLKEDLDRNLSKEWESNIPLYVGGRVPSMKLHYKCGKVGFLVSMQHRTTAGTDLVRLELAKKTGLIGVGAFLCCTNEFERYYFGTQSRRTENMITYEQVLEYMKAIGGIITIPLVVVGIDAPPDHGLF